MNSIQKNDDSFLETNKEVSLVVNAEETKDTFMSRNKNGGQNRNIKVANKPLENVAYFHAHPSSRILSI
jgi:hypothetical protein